MVSDLVPQAPVITTQPLATRGFLGREASLTVIATGFPLSYQWLFDSKPTPGSTNSVMTLRSARAEHTGSYSGIVSNEFGSVTSETVLLSLVHGPMPAGSVDRGFDSGETFRSRSVSAIAIQRDDKVLAGGILAFEGCLTMADWTAALHAKSLESKISQSPSMAE